jgi:hypothetical protein
VVDNVQFDDLIVDMQIVILGSDYLGLSGVNIDVQLV